MAVTPNSVVTPQKPKQASNVVTNAEASYTTPVNTALLFTTGTDGARVVRLRSMPRATVTATNLLLFVNAAPGSTTLHLIDSALMAANTLSTTTAVPKTDWGYSDSNPLHVQGGVGVYVATQVAVANGIATTVEWADY